MRIGALSLELEKAESHGGKIRLPSGGKPKEQVLSEAGISTTAAGLAGLRFWNFARIF
jgi:hypothetical protein